MEEQKPNLSETPPISTEEDANTAQTENENVATDPQNIEELLRLAELKATENHEAWLRAKAETENLRRRAQDDIAKASKFAIEKFAEALLPVKDTLEMALADPDPNSLRTGVEMILKNLVTAFDKGGIREEDPSGKKFDPNKHQAIATVDSEQEPNTVVNVLQKGYLIADRTLRPAMVTVAKTPTPAE